MNQLGAIGEQIAKKHLEEKGYEFVDSNYHTRFGEIDLIMKQGQEFLFIEVKTRRENNSVTQPFDLSEEKIEKCHSAMQEYAAALKIEEWRAELVGVTIMENGLAKITTAPL